MHSSFLLTVPPIASKLSHEYASVLTAPSGHEQLEPCKCILNFEKKAVPGNTREE